MRPHWHRPYDDQVLYAIACQTGAWLERIGLNWRHDADHDNKACPVPGRLQPASGTHSIWDENTKEEKKSDRKQIKNKQNKYDCGMHTCLDATTSPCPSKDMPYADGFQFLNSDNRQPASRPAQNRLSHSPLSHPQTPLSSSPHPRSPQCLTSWAPWPCPFSARPRPGQLTGPHHHRQQPRRPRRLLRR
jgi:hypothetical protein